MQEECTRLCTTALVMTTRVWKWTRCLSMGMCAAHPHNGILQSWKKEQWASSSTDLERAWRWTLSKKSLEQNSVCYKLLCIKRRSKITYAVSLPEEIFWKGTEAAENKLRQTGGSWADRWIEREPFYCLTSYFLFLDHVSVSKEKGEQLHFLLSLCHLIFFLFYHQQVFILSAQYIPKHVCT